MNINNSQNSNVSDVSKNILILFLLEFLKKSPKVHSNRLLLDGIKDSESTKHKIGIRVGILLFLGLIKNINALLPKKIVL